MAFANFVLYRRIKDFRLPIVAVRARKGIEPAYIHKSIFNQNFYTMKKIALSLILCVFGSALFAQQLASNEKSTNTPPAENAAFHWTETSFDFGKIKVNNPVTHEFTFMNAGDAPLVISSVQASCGCTVAKYSKDPVTPGSSGFVKATYNAAKVGVFTKTITVNSNTEDGIIQLVIKGEVVE